MATRPRLRLDAVHNLIFAGVWAIVTWRLIVGGIDVWHHGEESMMLSLPFWWGYVGGAVGCVMLTLVCLYLAVCQWREARG